MKTASALSDLIKSKPVPKEVPNKVISHSQFSMYNNCQYQWYLRYVQKLKPFSGSINTVFGTSMHEVVQKYLEIMYTKSIKKADELDLEGMLQIRLIENYAKERISNHDTDFTTQDEMTEFYEDGVAILRWFKTHRAQFFTSRGITLLGIEVPIMQPTDANPNVFITCYLDWVLHDETDDTIVIYDGKTSARGWKDDREKKDKVKLAQGRFYKEYFSRQFEIPQDKITVAFFIMKRKIWEQSEWPQPRISVFRPACGPSKMKEANFMLRQFIDECFTKEGEYNIDRIYTKSPGHACKYCPFSNDLSICDQKNNS